MIVTITLNPAIDKTIEIGTLVVGGLNRIENVKVNVGGKGINVSKMIVNLGAKTIATGFCGNEPCDEIEQRLKALNIENNFVKVNSTVRTNIKVHDKVNGITEFNEKGITATKQDEEKLMQILSNYANSKNIFVLSGSMHKGANSSFYCEIIKALKQSGAKVLLDADGEAFSLALTAKPNVIKPNKYELLKHFSLNDASFNQLIALCKKLINTETKLVALSMGAEGSIFVTQNETLYCKPLSTTVFSTVGAGDSMVGAIAYAMENNYTLFQTAKIAAACATGAITTKGTCAPSKNVVESFLPQVEIVKL